MRKRFLATAIILVMLASTAFGLGGCAAEPEVESPDSTATVQEEAQDAVESARAEYFITAEELNDSLGDVIVWDARPAAEYEAGHIPGAVSGPWQSFANMEGKAGDKGRTVLFEPDVIAQKLGALGMDFSKPVVVYADPNGWGDDGRIVWMLRMAGFENTLMLDGGYPYWVAQGYDTTTDVPAITPTTVTIESWDDSLTTTTEYIQENFETVKLMDSRSPKEWDGAQDYGEPRGGRIPGATFLPFKGCFNDDGTVMSDEDLLAMFEGAGFEKGDDIVVYCTSGIRSAHFTLLLKMLGYEDAKNYDASFNEWAGIATNEVETD